MARAACLPYGGPALRWLPALSLALALLVAASVAAQSSTQSNGRYQRQAGDYTVYYSAVRSSAIPATVARRHGLPQQADAILLNVAVEKDGRNVPVSVKARATNLTEQVRDVDMQAVTGNQMVSYLGVVDIEHGEVLDFELDIVPEGIEAQRMTIEFRERFGMSPAASREE